MLLIDCPYCGPHDEDEFHYGGPAHAVRPEPADDVSDAEWLRYLYVYRNRKGPDLERWVHGHGCRQWFNVVRDTLTHEILAVYPIDAEPPAEFRHLLASPVAETAASNDGDSRQ